MSVGGYTVRAIHRVGFMGIGLGGVPAPGDFAPLDDAEMATVRAVIVRKAQRDAVAAAEAEVAATAAVMDADEAVGGGGWGGGGRQGGGWSSDVAPSRGGRPPFESDGEYY